MPVSSGWPLKPGAIRFFVPRFASRELALHPLTKSLYINGLGLYPNASEHRMERRLHEDYLLMYCNAGSGRVETDNNTHQVNAGDLVLLPKGIPHRYESHPDTPWTLRWVHFDGNHALDYIGNINQPDNRVVIAIGQHPKLINDFDAMFSVRDTGYSMKALIHACQVLKQTLSYLALLTGSRAQQARQPVDLEATQALMMSRLGEQLGLDELAAASHLSRYHFAKRYKELTGYAPIQHFIHMKMERACYLLDIGNQSVGAVAAQLGYDDPHYFSRLFRKVTGLSPSEYRMLDKG